MSNQQLLSSLKLVGLDHLVQTVTQDAYTQLQQLAASLPNQSSAERKRALLQHLASTRQRLQRLDVLLQWAHKAPAVAECKRVLEVAAMHTAAFRDAADQLAFLHGELLDSRAPAYDVPTAMHVFQRRGYDLLPTIIKENLKLKSADGLAGGTEAALQRMDFLLRCKLLAEPLPAGMAVMSVGGGQAVVGGTHGQYSARLTLVPSPSDEVTVVKWSPPPDAAAAVAGPADGPGVKQEEAEVTQAVAAGGGLAPAIKAEAGGAALVQGGELAVNAEEGGPSEAAAMEDDASPAPAPEPAVTDEWRWRVLSFELLPRQPQAVLPPQLKPWLQRQVEDRMWAAGDKQQLVRLGKGHLIAVPPPPATQQQRRQKQRQLDEAGRGQAPATTAGTVRSGGAQTSSAQAAPSSSTRPGASGASASAAPSQQPGLAEGTARSAWADSPLAALHSLLQHAASNLVLACVLQEEGRKLESGPWAGVLKVRRLAQGSSGCRLEYWPLVPVLSYQEVQRLRGISATAAADAPPAATGREVAVDAVHAVHVVLNEASGALECSTEPPLEDPSTGKEAVMKLYGPGGAVSAERLLLTAAARSAALQLAGVQALLQCDPDRKQQLSQALGSEWHVEQTTVPANSSDARADASPRLLCMLGDEVQLSVKLDLRSAQPVVTLGSALQEDGEVVAAAEAAVAAAQGRLREVVHEAQEQALPPGHTRASLLTTLTADSVAGVWMQLAREGRAVALAGVAAAAGLTRMRAMPRCIAEGLREVPAAAALATPAAATLVLSVPPFPPPADLAATGVVAVGERGSVKCFLLVDLSRSAAGHAGQRMVLAVCAATRRGVLTRLQAVLPVPLEACRGAGQQPPPCATEVEPPARLTRKASGGKGGKRKRQGDASAGQEDAAPSSSSSTAAGIDFPMVAAWCLAASAQQQIEAQLKALQVPFQTELVLPTVPGAQPQQLLRAPATGPLQALQLETLPSAASAAGAGAGVVMQLDPESDVAKGGWTTRVSCSALADLPGRYAAWGLKVASSEGLERWEEGGVGLHHELYTGSSVLTALLTALRAAKLHAALARVLTAMHSPADASSKPITATQSPTLPGGGTVSLTAVSVTSATFLVSHGAVNGADVGDVTGAEGHQLTLKVQWTKGGAATEPAAGSNQGAPLSQLTRCSVASQPELPGWAISGLEALLEAGREAAFLAAVSALAVPAAALQSRLLTPVAQQAAGLLPGALTVEKEGLLEEGSSDNVALVAECTVLVRQLSRAARVHLHIGSDGMSLLRLQPLPLPGINPDTTWVVAVWEQQVIKLPGVASAGSAATPEGGCWECTVTAASLGPALQLLLRAVAHTNEAPT